MKKITTTLVCMLFLGFAAMAQSEAPAKTVKPATAQKVEAAEVAKAVDTDASKKECSKAKASCCAHGKKAEADKASTEANTSAEVKTVAAVEDSKKKGCCSKAGEKEASCHGSKGTSMASAETDKKAEVQPAEPKVEKQ